MSNEAAETFEDAWDAKYGAEPEADARAEEAEVEETSAAEETPTVEAEASEQHQDEPQPEPAQAQMAATPSPEEEELEALRKRYEGTKARYQAEERKRKELEERLHALEQQAAKPAAPAIDLDDAEVREIDAFRKAYPDVAKATVDDPKLAARWQKLLLERGEDEVLVLFETARGAASGPAEEGKRYVEEHRAEQYRKDAESHLTAIEKEHPDWFATVYAVDESGQAVAYNSEFIGWVEMLPLKVGQGVVGALQGGTADQINQILKAFKEYRANVGRASNPPRGTNVNHQPRTPQQQAAVKGALAVPGKGASPPKARPGSDASFDELWNAKYGAK